MLLFDATINTAGQRGKKTENGLIGSGNFNGFGPLSGNNRLFGVLLDQAFNSWRHLRAYAAPVGQAILNDTDTFFVFSGDWVVKTNTLNETAIATRALVSDNYVEERTCFGTAPGKSDNDHDYSFGSPIAALRQNTPVRQQPDKTSTPALRHVN
jgi:hypothetical protein